MSGRERAARSSSLLRWGARLAFALIVALALLLLLLDLLGLAAGGATGSGRSLAWGWTALLAVDAIGCLTIVVFDFKLVTRGARTVVRATLAFAVLALLDDIAVSGPRLWKLAFIAQILLIVSFQSATDRSLRAGAVPRLPWEGSVDPERREFVPLNFFNMFWVFAIASVAGLLIELVWHLTKTGEYQDRAGLV